MPFGELVIVLQTVDSTNNYVANQLRSADVAEGTVVMAQLQTEGRGQRGTHWQSESGQNLLMSLVLKPENLEASAQFIISQWVCLGLVRYLRTEFQIPAVIKWPNDILVDGQKLAGVLIENSVRGNRIENSIVGVGLNVNQLEFDESLQATSLRKINGNTQDVRQVLDGLLPYLEQEYRTTDYTAIRTRYLKALHGYRKLLEYRDDHGTFQAMIADIGPHGELILELPEGQRKKYRFKEVELLRESI
jgi:BirA family biotin operon repressor/biotin-[acetyl-CoA-carboxylase] ligase